MFGGNSLSAAKQKEIAAVVSMVQQWDSLSRFSEAVEKVSDIPPHIVSVFSLDPTGKQLETVCQPRHCRHIVIGNRRRNYLHILSCSSDQGCPDIPSLGNVRHRICLAGANWFPR